MMKNSRHLNTSTQTAGSLLPEMPGIHHLAMRAWMPDADFRNTAGKYHCEQKFMVERDVFCFRSGVSIVPHTPSIFYLSHNNELRTFLKKPEQVQIPLSPTTLESCSAAGPKGFSASRRIVVVQALCRAIENPDSAHQLPKRMTEGTAMCDNLPSNQEIWLARSFTWWLKAK